MKDNEETIRNFIAAWSRLDAADLASYFTEDGVYHNMPTEPVAGRAAVQAFIAGFAKDWTETNWDILNLIAKDDIVMVERLDRTKLGDKSVDLPCFGIFEMENGKIKVWRDYFDIGTYMKALA
ncbi:MAG: limonene-1,2-epoxide hydrolase [Parvibaculum sp.]|nr:limonene-1,2-epoxide hydrolase [Parvibaculum sp.]